jgi:DNA replication factor GINS
MMDLDELRAVQAGERSTDSLQSLRDSFYRDVAEYINGLRDERTRAAERADDPFGSEEVRHLTDEIETAQEVAEAIYDRRLGKVVKRASLAAAGMPADEEGLTDEEADLFGAVVDEIETRRGAVLSAFAGEADVSSTAHGADSAAGTNDTSDRGRASADTRADPDPTGHTPEATPAGGGTTVGGGNPPTRDANEADTGFDASEAMGGENAPREDIPEGVHDDTPETVREDDHPDDADERARPDTEGATPDGGRPAADRTTVRITRDVGEVLGVDESAYDLADGDVVTLPSANAEPLLERNAASRIK